MSNARRTGRVSYDALRVVRRIHVTFMEREIEDPDSAGDTASAAIDTELRIQNGDLALPATFAVRF
jgi:hypothetical protein